MKPSENAILDRLEEVVARVATSLRVHRALDRQTVEDVVAAVRIFRDHWKDDEMVPKRAFLLLLDFQIVTLIQLDFLEEPVRDLATEMDARVYELLFIDEDDQKA